MLRKTATLSFAIFAAIGASALAQVPASSYPVFFQPWSAAIDANASSTIAIAAKTAVANPTYPVVVTGSADTVGGEAANKDMALTRAQVVADALAADGVSASRIAIVSTGSISSPGTAPGSFAQFSRRVLIQVGN
jgi:outer membrane protein OmpA-like peptidoglycan-associated protein